MIGTGTGHADDPLALISRDPAGTPAPVARAQTVHPTLVELVDHLAHPRRVGQPHLRDLRRRHLHVRRQQASPRAAACTDASHASTAASTAPPRHATAAGRTPPADASPPPRSRCLHIRHPRRVSGPTFPQGPLADAPRLLILRAAGSATETAAPAVSSPDRAAARRSAPARRPRSPSRRSRGATRASNARSAASGSGSERRAAGSRAAAARARRHRARRRRAHLPSAPRRGRPRRPSPPRDAFTRIAPRRMRASRSRLRGLGSPQTAGRAGRSHLRS